MSPKGNPKKEFKSEKIFEKKYTKQKALDKDIKKIKKVLDGLTILSPVADREDTQSGTDIPERVIVYSLDERYIHYADVIVKVTNNDYLEVKVDHFGDKPSLDLKSRVEGELYRKRLR